MDIPRSQYRKIKFLADQKHTDYLLSRGFHCLQIADQLIHYMIEGIRYFVEKENPTASPQEILNKMRERVIEYNKLKHNWRGSRHSGI